MSTDDKFDSKKIMEDIEGLENDPQRKKASFKTKFINFIETFIFIILIGVVIVVVLYSCFDAMLEEIEWESEYTYDDYSSDTDYNEYEIYDDYWTGRNETLSENITLEEFLNSDIGNKILTESNQTNTIIEEEILEDDFDSEKYDSDDVLKQEIEEQKKNLIIKEEGKSVNNELIISVENKNLDFVHELLLYTVFYKDGKIISIDEKNIEIILKDNKKYLKLADTPEKYDTYDMFITKFNNIDYEDTILNEYVTCDSYIEDELVEIKIINNSNKKINRADMTIIYYDSNRNILDIDEVSDFNIWKSLSGSATGYGIWDEEKEEYIKYNDYEVILDAAIHYE